MTNDAWCYTWSEGYRAPQARTPIDGSDVITVIGRTHDRPSPHQRRHKVKRRPPPFRLEAVAEMLKRGPSTINGLVERQRSIARGLMMRILHTLEDDGRVVRVGLADENGKPVIWGLAP